MLLTSLHYFAWVNLYFHISLCGIMVAVVSLGLWIVR